MKRCLKTGFTLQCLLILLILAGCDTASDWGRYMWHPGQLSAWNQRTLKKESEYRCLNVGYPGHYYLPSQTAYFKALVSLDKASSLDIEGQGQVSVTLDGASLDEAMGIRLTAGAHEILVVSTTQDRLPCIRIGGCSSLMDPALWMVSTDGSNYLPVEYDPSDSRNPDLFPDDVQEVTMDVLPGSLEIVDVPVQPSGASSVALKAGQRLLVDFREIELGQVELECKGTTSLRFLVGESREEALSDDVSGFEQRALEDVSIQVSGRVLLEERALRYLSVTTEQDCEISALVFHTSIWLSAQMMTFECDDEDLNRLFNASVKTHLTSLHKGLSLDGVKRDCLPWAMDAVAGSLSLDYLYHDRLVGRNGISVALLPDDPQASDIGVMDYPLHGILGLEEDYLSYGDLSTWKMYRKRALDQTALYERLASEEGFISNNDPQWGFITGWNTDNGPSRTGTAAYAQMILMMNYRIVAFFLEKEGDMSLSIHYKEKARMLSENIIKHFWSQEDGAFMNGYLADGSLDRRISHHTQYWAMIAGLIPKESVSRLLSETVPGLPSYLDNVSYEKGYEALAYARAGLSGVFMDVLKKVFLRWLDMGHVRFPENLSIQAPYDRQLEFYGRPYGLSLCHGANGAPTIVTILYGILGLERSLEDPGTLTLRPDLMHLEDVEVTLPLPSGKIISLSLHRNGLSRVIMPDEGRVRLIFKGQDLMLEGGRTYEF